MGSRSLTGITWNHTRGCLPLVAAAQRFADRDPGVEIVWHKRSLPEFADAPIERSAESFDLLIIDHPFVGYVAQHPTLLPLDEYRPADYLVDQVTNSAGRSFESYHLGGYLWALAVDFARFVAGPVCQRGPYPRAGGQPGHRGAWIDPVVNARSGDFYRDTLPTLDEAHLRPRYDGYVPFQDRAGEVVRSNLRDGSNPRRTPAEMNRRYRESRTDDRP